MKTKKVTLGSLELMASKSKDGKIALTKKSLGKVKGGTTTVNPTAVKIYSDSK